MKNSNILLLFCIIIFFIGCGQQKPTGFPMVVPCNVSVTKDGHPIDNVMITFSPISNGGEWICSGTTGSDGVANITTILASYTAKGAPELEFKVCLTRPIDINTGVSQQEAFDMSDADRAKLQQEINKQTEAARIIPSELEFITSSPIRITVTKDEASYKIELNEYK